MFLIGATEVSADSYAEPTPYQIEFENGNKIFYMYPCYLNHENGEPDDRWLQSGLYYNTEPLENIYLINSLYAPNHEQIYFYQGNLIFSDDGIYFVHMPWTQSGWNESIGQNPHGGGPAVEFYENGKMIKRYFVPNLVADETKLEYSVSHMYWEKAEKRDFDTATNILTFTTVDDIIYRFDITTGNVIDIDKVSGNKPRYIIVVVSIIIVCMLILIFAIKKYMSYDNHRII